MADRGRDDDDDDDDHSSESSESDGELQTVTTDDAQETVKSIDPTSLWRDISQDKDLEQILTDLEKIRKLEKRNKDKDKTLTQQEQQRKEELEASWHSKESCYRPKIKECLERPTTSERPFIHVVIAHAAVTTLLMTNFILRLILEEDPDQIKKSEKKVPLLHRAIEVEINNLPGCKGLTSGICKLAKDPSRSIAIAMTNAMKENCLHLVVRHNIHDAKGIIALSDSDTFKQKRDSSPRDQMESQNTPLHDALHFSKVGKRKVPCEEGQSTQQGLQLCDECAKAAKANKELPDPRTYYDRMIKPLVKGCPQVLKEHNALGLPPYAFHLETRTQLTQELSKLTPTGAATEHNNGSRHKGGDDQPASRRDRLRPGNEVKPGLHKRAPTITFDNAKPGVNDRPSDPVNSKTQESREKVREGSKNQTFSQSDQGSRTHKESSQYDLKASDDIVASLEGWIDKMAWGYEDIIQCLFQNTKAKDRRTGSKPKNRAFDLPTRVSFKTTDNFDFLEFEPRLALLLLSLRPDNSYDVGQSEEKREEQAANDADNIIKVFRWLKGKGVKKILKVVVEDNPNRFCSEETIETCLECMDEIRFLNWNKRDLAIPTLSKAKNLTELSLYSSGINAVLHHWSDQNGLVKLPKLRKIHLHMEKGLEGAARNQINIRDFMTRLKGNCEASSKKREIEVVPDVVGMGEAGNTPSGKYRSKGLPSRPQKHPGFQAAEKFAAALYKRLHKTNSIGRKVKVALLDDGVNPEYENIGVHLACDGFPQASLDGHIAPFYKSTNGHGSKMASIISTICPFVEIYVAKIDNQEHLQHPAYNVEQAAAAVEWAVTENVDIISMSWILRVTSEVRGDAEYLNDMLDNDKSKNMILYCAARDNRGNDLADALYYPADCRTTKSIGGADTFNQPLRYVTLDKTDFVFPSKSVLPDQEIADGGNSVATAVATGVAALVLYCLREDKVRLKTKVTPVKLMELLFKKLRDKNSRYVDLAELFTCRDDEVITPKLLADRVLVKAGLVRSELDGFSGEGSSEKYFGFD